MKNQSLSEEFAYHPQDETSSYFEGWYYKTTTPDISFAVIVGISSTIKGRIAFIQTNSSLYGSSYEEFKHTQIHMTMDPFTLQLGKNVFSIDHMTLHLSCGIQAELNFHALVPLQKTTFMPTIMGPFAYLKHMECIHAIISLHHEVSGTLIMNEQCYQMKGIGYMEKDRGCSFPSSYLWFQSNQSEYKNACFFLSIAKIPLGIISFTGCICVLMINGRQLRFASYLGCRVIQHEDKGIYILKQPPYKLLIKMTAKDAKMLKAPLNGSMNTEIMESLHARAKLHLYVYKKRYVLDFYQGGYELQKERQICKEKTGNHPSSL